MHEYYQVHVTLKNSIRKNAKNKLDVGEEEKNLERMQQTKQKYLGSK